MRLGGGSYCWMWAIGVPGQAPPARPLDAFALMDRCAALGLDVVQLGPNLPVDMERLDELAAHARAVELEVEIGIEGLDAEAVRRGAMLCRRLGARLLRAVDVYEGPARTAAELEGMLRAALPLLDGDLVLALENAGTPAAVMAGAMHAIGSPQLGITLDTVNSLAIPEGTAEVVRHLAPFTRCLHVKDFRVRRIWHRMGFEVEGAPAGEGQLNIPWLLGALRAAGCDPNAILELWVPQQATLEQTIALEESWARQSIAYLRRLIPEAPAERN
jgi:3-oxoisoapionate decarboxylase